MIYLFIVLTLLFLVSLCIALTYQFSLITWALFFLSFGFIWLVADSVPLHTTVFVVAVLMASMCVGLSMSFVRRILSTSFFKKARKLNAHISTLEKQALAAGNAGFEVGFFEGKPKWEMLSHIPITSLTEEEEDFMNGPINNYCALVNDWEMRNNKKIPDEVWDYAKTHQFSGLRVQKEWGGKNFSFQAQSLILSKVASRSVDASILIELPTSLYPDEIINEHGTKEQKEYYLPRLARGEEIVAFAVTGMQGSDVGGMHDNGVVMYGEYNGKKILGIKLTFNKRYITFAPKSSLIVLAFSLKDPDNILQGGCERGITLALVPSNHPGVEIGKRHFPMGLAFPHGTIEGRDVFIPLEWVIGEKKGIGFGWQMIMQCLFVGRCLALPAISVGSIKTAFLTTTAYAKVRRQFGLALDTFEGVKEAITALTEITYVSESARSLSATLVDNGYRSLAVSSLMKYQITEYARRAINHALDVQAGRGVCDGPTNYLLSAYNAVPIGVTVEGANIVSRAVITFAQGVLQSHPYIRKKLESCEEEDYNKGLQSFSTALFGHIGLMLANLSRSLLHGLSGGYFASVPSGTPRYLRSWYQSISRYTSAFAFVSDITALFMAVELKKQQKLGGRLADILSELYLLTSVLKRYESDGYPKEDYPIIELCMQNGLHRIQQSLISVIRNFPLPLFRPLLRGIIFPLGVWRTRSSDTLTTAVADSVTTLGKTRDRLSNHMYISDAADDAVKRLEVAFRAAVIAEPVYKKIRVATRAGQLEKNQTQIQDAEKKGIITKHEAELVQDAEKTAKVAIEVDVFE